MSNSPLLQQNNNNNELGTVYVDITTIINEFFDILIRKINFEVFKKVFENKEEREKLLNELYAKQLEQLMQNTKQWQMTDIKGYAELKQMIEKSFELLKTFLCEKQQ